MNKKCPKCLIEKDASQFHRCQYKKDGLQSYCRVCLIENSKKDYRKNNRKDLFTKRVRYAQRECKKIIDELKEVLGCCNCSENTPCCIDFHHTHEKSYEISTLVRINSKNKLFSELKKCVAVCANCHRKIHSGYLIIEEGKEVKQEDLQKCQSYLLIES